MTDKIYRECLSLMDEGKDQDALNRASEIQGATPRAGILIDAGFTVGRLSAVREGIKLIEGLLSGIQPVYGGQTRSYFLYNLANGYMSAFLLSARKSKKWVASPNHDDMRSAKAYYRQAIESLATEPKSLKTQLWVNYGNCLSDLGRGIESIRCYKNALSFDENNGMALGNLGIELEGVARITGRYLHDYLLAAHSALSEALSSPRHLKYGGPGAVPRFESAKGRIEGFFSRHRKQVAPTRPAQPSSSGEQTKGYIRFCQENALFLNAWVGDQVLLPAFTDELSFPPITTPLTDETTVPELLEILNEIKESFATARYLYFLSLQPSNIIDCVSSLTNYFHPTGASGLRGIYQGLLKTAYARAFDILDKVARIINVYFGFGKRQESFWRVLVTKQSHGQAHIIKWMLQSAIAETRNFSLYALGDLSIDYFESEHADFKTIDLRRNYLTHDYLTIRSDGEAENSDKRVISENALREETLRTMKLAKHATLYAVSAIGIAEMLKKRDGKKAITVDYESIAGTRVH